MRGWLRLGLLWMLLADAVVNQSSSQNSNYRVPAMKITTAVVTTATPIAAPVERETIAPVGRSKGNITLNIKHCISWHQDVPLPVDGSSESKLILRMSVPLFRNYSHHIMISANFSIIISVRYIIIPSCFLWSEKHWGILPFHISSFWHTLVDVPFWWKPSLQM